ncbi:peptidoglycan editing factor PgeF [Thermochromatium tepidum]|uniref:Purine nucleoside phosphorylase n=1 Tax=Thermochromatium tepidum ATCC 43061 TaxID=316276 RepID=A0A6I6DWL3_THETI|nr:peptidoglycan editing factor PgeF [Thermochromatium tepidum]QGU31884.1 peptidoglycan editing factor PgeF [Thermochromatium tepidum ATCC 43061]
MELITPDWPAPDWVRACSTTRVGGVSRGPFASLNLGDHVGDDPGHVARNRDLLCSNLGLPAAPMWLRQVHGCEVARAECPVAAIPEADAAVATSPGVVCAVMTADCLPLLLCDEQGTRVAAVHAGWRGLAGGVLERAVAAMVVAPERLLAWMGPAIGPDAFEVGSEVRSTFVTEYPETAAAFRPSRNQARGERWLTDLFELARFRLARLGIGRVYGGGDCTFSQPRRFFSYRRDGTTGRLASLIWLVPNDSHGS